MTQEEKQVFDAAVEFIEAHGGIVLNPGESDESVQAKVLMHLEAELEEQKAEEEDLSDRISEAKEKFMKMLGTKQCSYSDVESMMLGYGLESDYLESFIHSI